MKYLNKGGLASTVALGGLTLIVSPALANASDDQSAATSTSVPSETAASDAASADILVTARRRSERLIDVPITVNVADSEQLAAAGVTSFKELSQAVPGLNVTYFGAVPVPTLRGITSNSTAAGSENNIAIYSDGLYQASVFGNTFDQPDIESIQVLKGPQGTLFGRNATGGAVLIQTRNPEFTPTGFIKISDGIFRGGANEVRIGGFVTTPLSPVLAFSVAGQYANNEGYLKDDLRGGRSGKIQSHYVRAKLLYNPDGGLRILVNGFYNAGKDYSVFSTQNLNSPFPDTPTIPYHVANDTKGYVKSRAYGINVRTDYEMDVGTITAVMGYEHDRTTYAGDVDGSPTSAIIYQGIQPKKTAQADISFSSTKLGRLSFVAGVNVYRNQEEFAPIAVRGTVDGPPFYIIDSRSIAKAVAGYAEANFDLTPKLVLTAGARYTYEHRALAGVIGSVDRPESLPKIATTHFSAATPRVSLRYSPTPDYSLFLTYSEGFKSGLYDSSGLPTTAVRPERLKSIEAGIKMKPLATVEVNAAVFRYTVSNLQTQTNTSSGLAILANAGSARLVGADFDITWRPVTGLTLSTAGTYLPKAEYASYENAAFIVQLPGGGGADATQDLSGTRIAKAPKLQLNAQARYETELDWGKIGGNLNVSYSSAFFYEVSRYLTQRKHALVNAELFWSPPGSELKLSIWGKNLTNRVTYNNPLVNATGASVVYQSPRQLGVSAAYAF